MLARILSIAVTTCLLSGCRDRPQRSSTSTVSSAAALPTVAANSTARDAGKIERPASVESLVAKVVDLMRTGRFDEFGQLLLTPAEATVHCPEMMNKLSEKHRRRIASKLTKLAAKSQRALEKCRAYGDWSTSKKLRVAGGKPKASTAQLCPKHLEQLEDIEISFDLGGKQVRLTLDDPFEIPGVGLGVAGYPVCDSRGSKAGRLDPKATGAVVDAGR